ncbi:MAG: 3,4-dihydroxy-2-butanone-4-phosphate synthase [Proteobacteria bacterium]|nr:3,4-dihydroxy-2-butanone-4-phosphate synthase [Pseudomonadota bacterium]
MSNNSFSSIEEAIAALKAGKMIILMDDEDRENEGDLCIAAEFATPESINFMAVHGRGLICLAMQGSLIDKFNLPMMVSKNGSPFGTAFTVSIEATTGVTTGISAYDRARTIEAAISKEAKFGDLISPGHIFPLRARDRGVLERGGQTEGSVDLAKLAGLTPAAVICEIMNTDGTMSRRDTLEVFAKEHGLLMVTIKALLEYRIRHEKLIEAQATVHLPLRDYKGFLMTVFTNQLDNSEHFVLIKEQVNKNNPPLVRIHSECITGDVFGSCKCDCGSQLEHSMKRISEEGGVLIYLRQEGRGIGLANKLKAYELQEKGLDTVEANLKLGLPVDKRNYAVAYQILRYLNIDRIRLLTNNPSKVEDLEKYGLEVKERLSVQIPATNENQFYLKTKKERLGHFLNL